MKLKIVLLIFITCFLPQGQILSASTDDDKSKLVLQITVDQLRGDLPMRFKERLIHMCRGKIKKKAVEC